MPKVVVRAPIHPSEDPGRVVAAARALFPDLEVLTQDDGELLGTTDSLEHLASLLGKQRILDAARNVLLRAVSPDGTTATFHLAKQAAAAGKVSFTVSEPPLGDFEVTVEDAQVDQLLRRIAPKTVKGFPVSEEEAARIESKERARRDHAKALRRQAREDAP